MEWLKQHADTALVLGAIFSSFVWMNGQFREVDRNFREVDNKIASLEKEMGIMKTVLYLKNVIPVEMVSSKEKTTDS